VERLTGHAELQELLGAYALDAVEPEEAAVIELHLATCPRCRHELAEHREVAALLGYAGGAAPSGVWDRIIASLEEPPPALKLTSAPVGDRFDRATRADLEAIARRWSPEPPPPPGGGDPTSTSGEGDGKIVPFAPTSPRNRPNQRRMVPMRFMVAIATAAALIVAALGVEVGRLQMHKSPQPVANLAALAYRLADANPAARHITLTAPGGQDVQAVIISDGTTYLGPGNLQVLPSDETYQMWGVVDGARISLGVIGDNPTYAAFTTPPVATVLAMTVETRGGVVSSTKTPVVEAEVPTA